jgi:hypothetical protein
MVSEASLLDSVQEFVMLRAVCWEQQFQGASFRSGCRTANVLLSM